MSVLVLTRTLVYLRFLPAINRLDRLTSGLMIIPLTAECARNLSSEFAEGTIQKEYIARCLGEFSEYVVTSALATSLRLELRWSSTELSVARDEVVCDQPLLTVDRQMGLNIVHPEGKVCLIIFLFCISLYAYGTCLVLQPAKTKFKRLHYDLATNTSVLHCTCKLQRELRDCTLTRYIQGRPLTGRCACSFFFIVNPLRDPCVNIALLRCHSTSNSGAPTISWAPDRERSGLFGDENLGMSF